MTVTTVPTAAEGSDASFASLHLHPLLLKALEELEFDAPTPIQRDSIPPALKGRHILACAATGSGKTAAFLLPILQRLLSRPSRGVTRALVLTPTRELAAQIVEHFEKLAKHTRLRAAPVFGGVGMAPQEAAFRDGVDVIVACPGRLLDHLKRPYARLSGLDVLVLDEVDRMLDMGFLPDVRRILRHVPKDYEQALFFSATMPKPIRELSRKLLKNPVTISVERRQAPATGVRQTFWPVLEEQKRLLLLELLQRRRLHDVLVFTRTKHRANRLADYLRKHKIDADRIHGNRSQAQRTRALADFKKGKVQVLVATDIAARGIDVTELSSVVNFDVPNLPEDYIHRVGRTARAGSTGDAYTFITPLDDLSVRAIEHAVGRSIDRMKLDDFDYTTVPKEKLEVELRDRLARHRAQRQKNKQRKAGTGAAKGRKGPAKKSASGHQEPTGANKQRRKPRRKSGGAAGGEGRAEQKSSAAGQGQRKRGHGGSRQDGERQESGRPRRGGQGRGGQNRHNPGRDGQNRNNQGRGAQGGDERSAQGRGKSRGSQGRPPSKPSRRSPQSRSDGQQKSASPAPPSSAQHEEGASTSNTPRSRRRRRRSHRRRQASP